MTETARIDLTVLGEALTLRSAESPEHLRRLAAYLEDRVSDLQRSGVRDSRRALIMAALEIADELFREREGGERDREVGRRIGALIATLERATAD
jgi:cell division protein ZapA (FtsZ GTPase activity inhibitor)